MNRTPDETPGILESLGAGAVLGLVSLIVAWLSG